LVVSACSGLPHGFTRRFGLAFRHILPLGLHRLFTPPLAFPSFRLRFTLLQPPFQTPRFCVCHSRLPVAYVTTTLARSPHLGLYTWILPLAVCRTPFLTHHTAVLAHADTRHTTGHGFYTFRTATFPAHHLPTPHTPHYTLVCTHAATTFRLRLLCGLRALDCYIHATGSFQLHH